ncbi:MAG: ABC transporter transmembrane domain-containing protein, partial [Oscillospiraceae bacterium]|nr:ABC transporter transmembrane domain-containing protein [Oscillospiraceae bacterium]
MFNKNKKSNKKKEKTNLESKYTLKKEVKELLDKENLDTDNILFSVTGDMDRGNCFCSLWLSLDKKGIYFAYGKEEVTKKRGHKKLKTSYSLEKLETFPIHSFDELKTEKYVATGMLIGVKGGEDIALAKFSAGLLSDFENFCKAYNTLREARPFDEFEKTLKTERICPKCGEAIPENRVSCPKCVNKKSVIRRMFSFFGGYKIKVLTIVSTLLVGSAISIYLPQLSAKRLIDDILLNEGISDPSMTQTLLYSLGSLVLTMFAIRFLSTVASAVSQYIIGGIMPRVIFDIKLKIFSAMQNLSVGFYSAKQTGSLMERVMTDSTNMYWFFVDGLPYIVTNIFTITGILFYMFKTSWKLSVMLIGILPIFGVCYFFGMKVFRRLHHKIWLFSANLTSMVSDNINGQRIIKAFSKEDEEYSRFEKASGKLMGSEISLANTEHTVFPIVFGILNVLAAFIFAMGGYYKLTGELTVGSLISYLVYAMMLIGPIEFLSWIFNWWARCVDSAQRIFEIVDSDSEIMEKENPVVLGDFKGDIEISELEFEYEPAKPVIKKLDLKAKAGEMLGIVGKTGAGKTTIANLIARFYDAKTGNIRIDGVDVKDLSLKQLRENIGVVSQDIYLFMGSIADNIRYARPE